MQTSIEPQVHSRRRPAGWPFMYQTWDKLLFMHWPISADELRPLVPDRLEIDQFDGTAWIGVTPFTIYGIRPPILPAIPIASSTHEVNVRTYVTLGDKSGVWFLSLDASNFLAVQAARLLYALNYYRAAIELSATMDAVWFHSERSGGNTELAILTAEWTVEDQMPESLPGTLEYFLTERYRLFAKRGDKLYSAPIYHRPWPLAHANLDTFESTMIESHGLSTPPGEPLLFAQTEPLDVEIWPLERV